MNEDDTFKALKKKSFRTMHAQFEERKKNYNDTRSWSQVLQDNYWSHDEWIKAYYEYWPG